MPQKINLSALLIITMFLCSFSLGVDNISLRKHSSYKKISQIYNEQGECESLEKSISGNLNHATGSIGYSSIIISLLDEDRLKIFISNKNGTLIQQSCYNYEDFPIQITSQFKCLRQFFNEMQFILAQNASDEIFAVNSIQIVQGNLLVKLGRVRSGKIQYERSVFLTETRNYAYVLDIEKLMKLIQNNQNKQNSYSQNSQNGSAEDKQIQVDYIKEADKNQIKLQQVQARVPELSDIQLRDRISEKVSQIQKISKQLKQLRQFSLASFFDKSCRSVQNQKITFLDQNKIMKENNMQWNHVLGAKKISKTHHTFTFQVSRVTDGTIMIGIGSQDLEAYETNRYLSDDFISYYGASQGMYYQQMVGYPQPIGKPYSGLQNGDIIRMSVDIPSKIITWNKNGVNILTLKISDRLLQKGIYPVVIMLYQGDEVQYLKWAEIN